MGIDATQSLKGLRDMKVEKVNKRDDALAEVERLQRQVDFYKSMVEQAERRVSEAVAVVDRYNTTIQQIENAIRALEALTAPATMKVEGEEISISAGYKVLKQWPVPSDNPRSNRVYTIEARLYGQRIVLTCDCPRFLYTRGEYAHGEKDDCKHIARFKFERGARWLNEAYRLARRIIRPYDATIFYFNGFFDHSREFTKPWANTRSRTPVRAGTQ